MLPIADIGSTCVWYWFERCDDDDDEDDDDDDVVWYERLLLMR